MAISIKAKTLEFKGRPQADRIVRLIVVLTFGRAMCIDKTKVQKTPLSPDLRLNSACEIYLARRKRHLRPRSLEAYQYHFRTLMSFFDPKRKLSFYHEGDHRDYQRWRGCSDACQGKAGPSLINHELGALAQVLK